MTHEYFEISGIILKANKKGREHIYNEISKHGLLGYSELDKSIVEDSVKDIKQSFQETPSYISLYLILIQTMLFLFNYYSLFPGSGAYIKAMGILKH